MKQLIQVVVVVAVALATVAVVIVTSEPTQVVSVPAIQPQREPYVAPVWVTNEQGQRCIQQGTTVTCG